MQIENRTLYTLNFSSFKLDSPNHEKAERGYINSSGYYIEPLTNPNTCKLGFWIEGDLKTDPNLEDHILRDYLNHLIKIKDNIMFDLIK